MWLIVSADPFRRYSSLIIFQFLPPGIGLFSVTSDVISFIKQSGEIIDNYYPEQVARLVICNAPTWFTSIWGVIAKVLPASVQKKVDILYDVHGLDKYIHTSMRPAAYGGTDVPLGQADGHLEFLKLETEWNRARGKPTTTTGSNDNNKQSGGRRPSNNHSSKETESYSAVGDQLMEVSPTSSNSSKSTGGGVLGWLKTRIGGGSAKTTAPKAAFLGEKNSYRYNAASGKHSFYCV